MIKKNIKKIGYVGLCLLTAIFFFAISTSVRADTKELTGYAWSSNIGWISFNCLNTGTCATVDYKVSMDDVSGDLTGYGWSSNIGWVSFNPAVNNTCPSGYGACQANAPQSEGGGYLTGWARAIAGCQGDGWNGSACTKTGAGDKNGVATTSGATVTGNWDGWIYLGHVGVPNGVFYQGRTTGKFEGYAWGHDVVDWVKFDIGTNEVICPTCASNDYCLMSADPYSNIPGGNPDDMYLQWEIFNASIGTTYTVYRNGQAMGLSSTPSSGYLVTNSVDENLPPGTYTYQLFRGGGPLCSSNTRTVGGGTSATGKLYLGTNPNTVQTSMDVDDYVDVRWDVDPTLSCSSTQISGPATISAWTSASIGAATGVQRVSDLVEGNYVLGMTCANASGTNVPINTVRITVQRGYIEEL